MGPREGPSKHDAQLDALDRLIEQERRLITYYEARQASADAVAAAAVTGVIALAALTATVASSNSKVDKTFAWITVGMLIVTCLAALVVRFFSGLHHTRAFWVSTGSTKFDRALSEFRSVGRSDPIDAGDRILDLSRARADDAHRAAVHKDRAAAVALMALAAAVILTAFALLSG